MYSYKCSPASLCVIKGQIRSSHLGMSVSSQIEMYVFFSQDFLTAWLNCTSITSAVPVSQPIKIVVYPMGTHHQEI